jgi:transposase InsO family protein
MHVRGMFLYLYLVVDVYSRKIVGYDAGTAEGCHSFRAKPATRTGARLPPIGA